MTIKKTEMEMLKIILIGINEIISEGKFTKKVKKEWDNRLSKFLGEK